MTASELKSFYLSAAAIEILLALFVYDAELPPR
jgi:hypothetical protein